MSFYPQPNSYQCGPFALKYALVMLGIFKNENSIGITAGSNWWSGTDEIGLARAAKKYKCSMKHFYSDDREEARKLLNKKLLKNYPCILSVNNWEHWVTVVNYTRGKYIIVDSGRDKVITIWNRTQLLKHWRFRDENETSYDGYAIVPKFKVQTRAKFKLEQAKSVMFEKNSNLAIKWDQYFNDLISITKPRTKLTLNYLTFQEFLRRNESLLVKKVADWHGIPTYAEVDKILQNMKFIASIYDLIIPIADEKKVLIDLSSLLMMYACGKYGMDKIY